VKKEARGRIAEFRDNWNWFLFDMIFKPVAVCSIIILERWFTHRLGQRAKETTLYQTLYLTSKETGKKIWGMNWTTYILMRAISLIALFCESDNAYKVFVREFLVRLKGKRL
jgi:hypothetical protein